MRNIFKIDYIDYYVALIILILIATSISHTLWLNLDITLFGDIGKYLNINKITQRYAPDWKPFTNILIISNLFIINKISLAGLIFTAILIKLIIFYFCIKSISDLRIRFLSIFFIIISPHNLVFEFIISKEYILSILLTIVVFLIIEEDRLLNSTKKYRYTSKLIEYLIMILIIKLKFFFITLFLLKLLFDLYFLKLKANLKIGLTIFLITTIFILIIFFGSYFIPPVIFDEELILNTFRGSDPVLLSSKEISKLAINQSCLYCSETFLNSLKFILFSVNALEHIKYSLIWVFILENTFIKILLAYFLFLFIKKKEVTVLFLICVGLVGSILPYCMLNSGASIRYWGSINEPLILTICYFYYRTKKLNY